MFNKKQTWLLVLVFLVIQANLSNCGIVLRRSKSTFQRSKLQDLFHKTGKQVNDGRNRGQADGSTGSKGGSDMYGPIRGLSVEEEQMKADLLSGQIEPAMLENIPLAVCQGLDEEDFVRIKEVITPEHMEVICERLISVANMKTVKIMMRNDIHCGIPEQMKNMKGGRSVIMIEMMKEGGPPSSWNKAEWKEALAMKDGLTPDDLKGMGSDALRGMIADGTFQTKGVKRKDQVRALNKVIKRSYGNPETWNSSTIAELADGGLMDSLNVNMLKQLDAEDLATQLGKFKDHVFKDKSKKAALGEKLLRGLGGRINAGNMTLDQVKNAGQFILTRSTYLDKVDPAVLANAMGDITQNIASRSRAANLAKRVKRMSSYSDMSGLTSAEISDLGPVLPLLGKSALKNLNPTNVLNSMEQLAGAKFRPQEARLLSKRIMDAGLVNPSTMDTSMVEQMGPILNGMKSAELGQIPRSAIRDNLATIGKLAFRPAQGRAMVEAVKDGGNLGSMISEMRKLMKYVRKSEFSGVSFTDLNMTCDDSAIPLDLEISRTQAQLIMEKAVSTLGEPSRENTNYTSGCAQRWAHAMAIGMSTEQIEGLSGHSEILNIAEVLSKYDGIMEESELRAWTESIQASVLHDASDVDESIVNQVGSFFKFFSAEALEELPSEQVHTVCRKIGESSLRRVPLEKIQRIFAFCLKHVNRDGAVVDVEDAETLTDDDINHLGQLRCGMIKKHAERLSEDALMNNLPGMTNCSFDSKIGEQIMDTTYDKISNFLSTSDNLVMAAGQLHHLSREKMDAIDQEALADAFIDIAEAVHARLVTERDRLAAFPHEEHVDENDAELLGTDSTSNLLHKGLEAIRITEITEEPDSRRRKRWAPAVSTITCADIQAMGSAALHLTEGDIFSLSTEDFEDCAETLGSISNWNPLLLIQLRIKAKETWGSDVGAWNVSQITEAGSIIAGLEPDEIQLLDLSEADTVFSISQHDLYSSDQLDAAFTAWMTANSETPATIDSANFLSINNFLCGATTDHIDSIVSAEYGEAADSIGALSCFKKDQMEHFMTHAKAVYGSDITTWTPQTISTAGNVIGGMSKEEFGTLSFYQLATVLPTTISTIPADVFAGVTTDQLLGFTTSQATAVTVDQQLSLSNHQMAALISVGGVDRRATSYGLIAGSLVAVFLLGAAVYGILAHQRKLPDAITPSVCKSTILENIQEEKAPEKLEKHEDVC